MVGRSSRSRGVCQGSLFIVSDERSGRVIDRLKLQGVASLQGVAQLMQVLEKRQKDSNFIKTLIELRELNINIKTYNDLKENIEENQLDKYLKDVFV